MNTHARKYIVEHDARLTERVTRQTSTENCHISALRVVRSCSVVASTGMKAGGGLFGLRALLQFATRASTGDKNRGKLSIAALWMDQ
jgi:hypothetical protein